MDINDYKLFDYMKCKSELNNYILNYKVSSDNLPIGKIVENVCDEIICIINKETSKYNIKLVSKGGLVVYKYLSSMLTTKLSDIDKNNIQQLMGSMSDYDSTLVFINPSIVPPVEDFELFLKHTMLHITEIIKNNKEIIHLLTYLINLIINSTSNNGYIKLSNIKSLYDELPDQLDIHKDLYNSENLLFGKKIIKYYSKENLYLKYTVPDKLEYQPVFLPLLYRLTLRDDIPFILTRILGNFTLVESESNIELDACITETIVNENETYKRPDNFNFELLDISVDKDFTRVWNETLLGTQQFEMSNYIKSIVSHKCLNESLSFAAILYDMFKMFSEELTDKIEKRCKRIILFFKFYKLMNIQSKINIINSLNMALNTFSYEKNILLKQNFMNHCIIISEHLDPVLVSSMIEENMTEIKLNNYIENCIRLNDIFNDNSITNLVRATQLIYLNSLLPVKKFIDKNCMTMVKSMRNYLYYKLSSLSFTFDNLNKQNIKNYPILNNLLKNNIIDLFSGDDLFTFVQDWNEETMYNELDQLMKTYKPEYKEDWNIVNDVKNCGLYQFIKKYNLSCKSNGSTFSIKELFPINENIQFPSYKYSAQVIVKNRNNKYSIVELFKCNMYIESEIIKLWKILSERKKYELKYYSFFIKYYLFKKIINLDEYILLLSILQIKFNKNKTENRLKLLYILETGNPLKNPYETCKYMVDEIDNKIKNTLYIPISGVLYLPTEEFVAGNIETIIFENCTQTFIYPP